MILEFAVDEILTYEEMVEVYPDPAKKRPIVLIGNCSNLIFIIKTLYQTVGLVG